MNVFLQIALKSEQGGKVLFKFTADKIQQILSTAANLFESVKNLNSTSQTSNIEQSNKSPKIIHDSASEGTEVQDKAIKWPTKLKRDQQNIYVNLLSCK